MEDPSLVEQLLALAVPLAVTAAGAVAVFALTQVRKIVKRTSTDIDDKILAAAEKAVRDKLNEGQEPPAPPAA